MTKIIFIQVEYNNKNISKVHYNIQMIWSLLDTFICTPVIQCYRIRRKKNENEKLKYRRNKIKINIFIVILLLFLLLLIEVVFVLKIRFSQSIRINILIHCIVTRRMVIYFSKHKRAHGCAANGVLTFRCTG